MPQGNAAALSGKLALFQGKPGGREDIVEVGVAGGPVEFAANFFGAGDERGRIAGAARGFYEGDFPAGDAACGGDDFADARAGAVAEIVDALIGVFKGAEDEKVRASEIVNVNEVADAGTVGSGIVGAEDGNRARRAECSAENVGDEMGFGIVIFGVAVPRAGGVEIAENRVAEAVNLAEPFEHDFGLQLGLTVGIDGHFARIFADGNGSREAEDRAGRGEDKAHNLVAEAGFEKSERSGSVVAEIESGILHGLGYFGERGEVHDGVNGRFGEEPTEEGGVGDVADNEARGGRDGGAMAAGKVIEHGDMEIVLQQEADGGSADVASAAGDEDVLGHKGRINLRMRRNGKLVEGNGRAWFQNGTAGRTACGTTTYLSAVLLVSVANRRLRKRLCVTLATKGVRREAS